MQRLTRDQAFDMADKCLRDGRQAEARRIYETILEKFPADARARKALSALQGSAGQGGSPSPPPHVLDRLAALCRAERFEEAVAEAEKLVPAFQASLDLWTLLGGACTKTGRLDRAEHAFRQAIALMPEHPGAHYNLGLVLQQSGRPADAIKAYRKALRRKPDHAGALNNLGNALADLGRANEAERAFVRAIEVRSDHADAYCNLGRVLKDQGRAKDALAAWERALEIEPGHDAARAQKLRLQWEFCDFRAYEEFLPLRNSIGITGARIPPFALLAAEDDPARQRLRAEQWAQGILRPAPAALAPPQEHRPDRLRIGFFSANFHDHPALRLTSGLYREIDRERFDVTVYSYGRRRTGTLRDQLQRDVPDFHDVEHLSPTQIAAFAHDRNLDIAIDLDGYTRGARSEIFAHRPAPVIIGYLGFPGTSGAEFVDYLIADAKVVPKAERPHYSESLIFLPDTYLPGDNKRTVPPTTDTRADHGLPEIGLVFCCFNNSYKIGPREFGIWMRILRKVEGSVLWLLQSNGRMVENLRREAIARGVDPDRLVFAPKCPHDDHLARHRHADLFLDTFRYNAHTTAYEALWSGLPVVTMAGRQFTSRVAASLLAAVGLTDLVTTSEKAYEAVVLDLAARPDRIAEIRARLSEGRQSYPLFDTARYTRHFEEALDAVHERYRSGEPPRDIHIGSAAGT